MRRRRAELVKHMKVRLLTLEGVEVKVPGEHVSPPAIIGEHVYDGIAVLRVDGLLHLRAPRMSRLCGLQGLDGRVIEAWR